MSPEGLVIGKASKPWRIGKKLGSGACGSVHELHQEGSTKYNNDWAIKLAPLPKSKAKSGKGKRKKTAEERNADLIQHENLTLQNAGSDMRGRLVPDIPYLGSPPAFGETSDGEYRFLVMERMDKPIDEVVPILLDLHGNKTGVSKIGLGDVSIAMVNCIEAMHNNGNLFVDVKTENFMLARNNSNASSSKKSSKKSSSNVGQLVRLIDFGLVERFGDMSTSKHRENLHPDAQLVGTPTYASLNVSSGHTVSRRDDLESVGYIISELILMLVTSGGKKKKNDNVLPWSQAKSDEEVFRIKSQEMDKSKRSKSTLFTALKSCGADGIMIKYFSAVQTLSYAEKPDYDLYRTLLKKLVVSVESGGSKKKASSATSPKKKAAAKSPARRTSARRKQADDEDSDAEMVDEENVENRKKAASSSTSSSISSKKQKLSVGKESAKAPRRTKRSATKSRTIGTQTDVEVINVDDSDDDDDMDWEKVEASASEESKEASSKGNGILKLDIIEGPHKGQDISIGGECQDTVIVGRDTESSATKKDTTKFSIPKDSSASAVHAKFVINTKSSVSSIRITDMSSSSSDGTFINGSCLASGKSKQAFVGDKIKVGESTFQISKKA